MMKSPIQKARGLRSSHTDAENVLWQRIRNSYLGHKFRRQAPVGRYIVDFLCLEMKLIAEVDGSQHADNQDDLARTAFLNGLGFEVIRFWNNDVLENIDGVLETIRAALLHRQSTLTLPRK